MILKRLLVTVSLALLFDVAAIGQQSRHFGEERFREGLRTAQLMSNVLARAQVSGSLEFNAKCGPGVLVPDLPPVREPRKPYGPNAANTLRSMFAVDNRLVISQESNGTIRVVESGVQTDILHLRINHLSFNDVSDPDQALNTVLGTPEVQSFIQTHGIGQPFNSFGELLYSFPGLTDPPLPEVRGISGELNNVTLADALDYVLKTFPGFWVYRDCETRDQRRVVYFGLFPVPGRMWFGQNDDALVK